MKSSGSVAAFDSSAADSRATPPEHSTAVFLGPSLSVEEARELLIADYFPPARKGDIYRIVASGVETIVLVDGVFHNTPSVWPREILTAIEEGIEVIGAASMGALRAAELRQFGMQGYGTIFEWYRSGLIDGDDEVAVSHASAEFGFRPLSEALVNIRFTLNRAVQDDVLTSDQANQLLAYAKQLYYPERSYRRLLSSEVVDALPEQSREVARNYLSTCAVNLKKADSIGVLLLAARKKPGRPAAVARVCRDAQDFWEADRSRLSGLINAGNMVRGEAVLQLARQDPQLLGSMRRKLARRRFVLEWARQHDFALEDEFLSRHIRRWEECHDIDSGGNWLRANGLTRNHYRKLLQEYALIDWTVANAHEFLSGGWDFQEALRREHRRRGFVDPTSDGAAGMPLETPLPDQDVHDDAVQIRTDVSYRGCILQWARENGVFCPGGVLQDYRAAGEQRHSDLSSADEKALTEWIIRAGPTHFGILWSFEDSLLRELQVTGRAAALLRARQPS